jgi:hypothetical protein
VIFPAGAADIHDPDMIDRHDHLAWPTGMTNRHDWQARPTGMIGPFQFPKGLPVTGNPACFAIRQKKAAPCRQLHGAAIKSGSGLQKFADAAYGFHHVTEAGFCDS